MITSRYTFLTAADPGQEAYLVNHLSGALDVVEPHEVDELRRRLETGDWEGYTQAGYLYEQGYLFSNVAQEEDLIQEKYLEFADEYDRTQTQLIFATTYACNFSCDYCFQEEYMQNRKSFTREIADEFFAFANRTFANESVRPYITLFGGEPLLLSPAHRDSLEYFLRQAARFDYEIAIVTNGFGLTTYVPVFKEIGTRIKEIQVTLDGGRSAHDRRRVLKNGRGTFDRIAEGVSLALEHGYRINLRMILDRANLDSLPELAAFAEQRGWLEQPPALFQTTFGRNYELHTCQHTDRLYTRTELYRDYARLAAEHPILFKFHRPGFHGIKHLSETGELPPPIFDGCPAGKKEFAFDLNGDIYGCTASVGVQRYRLGRFTGPDAGIDPERNLPWETRDVLTMESCRTCPESLMCGGGCAVLACNEHGSVHSPDCRPVKELVRQGMQFYGLASEPALASETN